MRLILLLALLAANLSGQGHIEEPRYADSAKTSNLDPQELDDWEALVSQAEKLQSEGRFGDAKRILLLAKDAALTEHRQAYTLHDLGSVAQDEGHLIEAEKYYHRALRSWELSGQRSDRGLARTLNNLASLRFQAGDWKESLDLLRRSEEIDVRGNRQADFETALTIANEGAIELRQHKFEEAEKSYRRARTILETQGERGEVLLARVSLSLAQICHKSEREAEALAFASAAQRLLIKRPQIGNGSAEILVNLAAAHSFLGDLAQAKELVAVGLSAAERQFGSEHVALTEILWFQAELLRRTGQKRAAKKCEARAAAIKASDPAGLGRLSVSISSLFPQVRGK